MTTMISNLPSDLIEEIISRVPLKSMKSVKLTCKSWNNLSKSESFVKATRTIREGETMLIGTRGHEVFLISVVVDDVNPSIELKGQLSFLNDEVNITGVLHFEGLLLFKLKDITRIVVWNPYWGQTVWINLRYSHRPYGINSFSYALGYEGKESCRSFKLLRFIDYFYYAPQDQFFWYEIYDFDSGLWATLDVTPLWRIRDSPSVSLKGNTYWCTQKRSLECYKHYIICFDFTRESFGPFLPLPVDVRDLNHVYVTLSCVKEEKLVALFQHDYASKLEIWITTKIDVEMVSWSKFLRINTGPELYSNVSLCFFIDEVKKVCMEYSVDSCYLSNYLRLYISIIVEAGYLKTIDMAHMGLPVYPRCMSHHCSYVPSLVQIRKPSRRKRIKESRLEKRRFDQYMSRLSAFEKLVEKKE